MRSRTLVVMFALVGVVAVTGASAFTTATVARDAQIDVADDGSSVIELGDGTVDGASVTDGTLEIDGEESDSLNREALFRFGDNSTASDAQSEHAFTITNADEDAHTFDFELSGAPGVTIELWDDSGEVATVGNGNSVSAGSVSSSSTLYAVIIVDTGTSTGTDAIDGTLTIEATTP
jgi:hypothetical protein